MNSNEINFVIDMIKNVNHCEPHNSLEVYMFGMLKKTEQTIEIRDSKIEDLEKEISEYKRRFDDISKKIDSLYGPTTSSGEDIARLLEDPLIQDESFEENETIEEMSGFSNIKIDLEELNVFINKSIPELLNTNTNFVHDFNDIIKKYGSEILHSSREFLKRKEEIKISGPFSIPEELFGIPLILNFTHIMPENGEESILKFEIKNGSNETLATELLVPNCVVIKILELSTKEHVNKKFLKSLSDTFFNSHIKLGVNKYWHVPDVQFLNSIKNQYLLNITKLGN